MAVNLTKVDHGAPNWENTINDDFQALNQDTGVINLTMIGPLSGLYSDNKPSARRLNGEIHLNGGIKASEKITAGSKVISMPAQFIPRDGWIITACMCPNTKTMFAVSVRDDGIYIDSELGVNMELDFSSIVYPGQGA